MVVNIWNMSADISLIPLYLGRCNWRVFWVLKKIRKKQSNASKLKEKRID